MRASLDRRPFARAVLAMTLVVGAARAVQGGVWSGGFGPEAFSNSVSLATNGNGVVFAGTFGGGVLAATSVPPPQVPFWVRMPSGLPSRFLPVVEAGPDGAIYARTSDGIFRLAPATSNWTPVIAKNPDGFIAGTYDLAVDGAGSVYIGGLNGAFKYTLGDGDWTALPTAGLPNLFVLDIAADASGNALAVISDGIYRLANGAGAWVFTNADVKLKSVTALLFDSGGTAWTAANGHVLYLPPGSTDWVLFEENLPTPNVSSLAFAADGWLYGGTSDGVLRAKPGVTGWQGLIVVGLPSPPNVSAVATDGFGRIFASSGCAIYSLTPSTSTWVPVPGGLNATVFKLALYPTGVLYALPQGCGPAKRLTNGSWSPLSTAGLATDGSVSSLAVDASPSQASGTLYAGSGSGNTWKLPPATSVWTALSTLPSGISPMVVDDDGFVYAGTSTDGVYRLPPDGTTWAQLPLAALADHYVFELAVRSNGQVVSGTPSGVFTLSADALSWQTTLGLPGTPGPLVRNAADDVFTTTGDAVYKLALGSSTWSAMPTAGLAGATTIAVDPDGSLYAGASFQIYKLAPGASAWTPLGGAPVLDFNPIAMVLDPVAKTLHVSLNGYGIVELTAQCNDGVVDVGESCDPQADPTGCSASTVCMACTCVTTTTTTTVLPSTSSTVVVPSSTSTTTVTTSTVTTTVTTSTATAPTVTTSTATAPTVTTSTGIPTTTTTRPPFCGDKNIDVGEDCDDGDPLSEIDCCNQNCKFRQQFTVCGQAAVGPCAKPSTCNGNGTCMPRVKDADSFECRGVGELDDCDLGDSCDGASADCPTTHEGAGCMAETPDTVRKPLINVKCEAILKPESGESDCEASGTDASAALLVGDDAAAVSGGLVTQTIRKTLKRLKNGTYQRLLKLHLNATGRRVLKERGNLPVRVTITINHGRAHGHQVIHVVNVLKKKKS